MLKKFLKLFTRQQPDIKLSIANTSNVATQSLDIPASTQIKSIDDGVMPTSVTQPKKPKPVKTNSDTANRKPKTPRKKKI